MTSRSQHVLVVSKPLGPPWNDGSKNLARDLVEGLAELASRHRTTVFAPRTLDAAGPALGGTTTLRTASTKLGPEVIARMLVTLATERRAGLWHFFFAPNPRTSTVARALARARRRPTVQTVASAPPREADLASLLFGDRVVVLSRATELRALEGGFDRRRLLRIGATTRAPAPPTPGELGLVRRQHALSTDRFVVCFPGDLEHGSGADLLLDACARAQRRRELILVMACRAKTPRSRERRAELSVRAARAGVETRWVGETPMIHALLAASDLVALPTDTLYAKVDHPIVLLEAMHLGRPVLVTEGTAAFELAEDGGALGSPHEAAAVAAILDDLVDHRPAWLAAGARAAAAAAERTITGMARAYDSIYDELLA